MDRKAVKRVLRGQEIELPSWAFGNSGTRFKVFAQPGGPRDPYGAVTTGGVRRARRPPATSRWRRSARMFEAIPSSDRSCRLRKCCRT
jgi:L-rhamnose isomerase